jgi:hypothetical protein
MAASPSNFTILFKMNSSTGAMNDGIYYKYKEFMQIYTVHRNPKPPFPPSFPLKKDTLRNIFIIAAWTLCSVQQIEQ